MVDLVKIRKKKAEKKKAEEAAAAAESSSRPADASGEEVPPPTSQPVVPSRKDGEGSPGTAVGSAGVQASTAEGVGDQASRAAGSESAAVNRELVEAPSAARATAAALHQSSKLDKFKAEAGKRRETVAAQAEEQGENRTLEALTFLIAGEQYAVDIERIVEIVTPRPATRIPNASSSILGIISLRGTIVTLVDVRQKLGHPRGGDATPDTRIVVIDNGSETVGFVVDRVLRVVKTSRDALEPHPVVHAAELNEAILGVFRIAGALTILLDLDKLLDHDAPAAVPA
jgi:purine-binding chemotaxis protein CheW